MGVPKFFRWLSERYPSISQLIAENRIPEFDCLYLDMNGIIHNCTHSDSDSATHRVTEDKMFIAIFNYIEHLFGKIKPQKLFFMAIDGVAPRAKMNQQRARRFRTALDAEKAREKAIQEGITLPKEDAFDSNCITPGTEFMARLTEQLKYFISKKVSEDKDWQGVEVVLSGHEVPGEGEHKIMEYIRLAKAQPGYDPNVRHCLYGLDADLIMLGLLSHDPHFCLLREEVTFGRQNGKRSKELEHQNFYLMHLCIVREYLELEFQELQKPGVISFPFDMERVIDDFILMAFFVGNDFLPNLPNLHINEGALSLMFKCYKTMLPKTNGYINEGGTINLPRLKLLLDELSSVEYRFFEAENQDANWLKSKQKLSAEESARAKKKGKLILSNVQKSLFLKVKALVQGSEEGTLDFSPNLPAADRKFIQDLAESLKLNWSTVQDEKGRFMRIQKSQTKDGEEEEEDEEDNAYEQQLKTLRYYDRAQVVDKTDEDLAAELDKEYEKKFFGWKNTYYHEKFGWDLKNEAELKKITENYVQGLQWVLYYYYRGIVSWPWFYQYHYSPMISDVKNGLGANMKFELGQPFKPYEQLMGVLPDRSKKIVPEAYWPLMTSPESPIIDFYPRNFELDMNGKKQEWEAIVKIPFIQEDRLLSAMKTKEGNLTDAERARNNFGVSLKFTYSQDLDYTYPSSLVGIFNDIKHCHTEANIFEPPTMDGLDVYVGLVDGAKLGASALAGFPSLKTLKYEAGLAHHGINVFQRDSANESMIVTLQPSRETTSIEYAKAKLGKSVHLGYPFLQEGRVTVVSDELHTYWLDEAGQVTASEHSAQSIDIWRKKASRLEQQYSKRLGIVTGDVECLVEVDILKGLKKTDEGATVKDFGIVDGIDTEYIFQTVVPEVINEDQRFIEKEAAPVEQEYPVGTKGFFLGEMGYGSPCEVIGHTKDKLNIRMFVNKNPEPDFGRDIARNPQFTVAYTPAYTVARMLHLNPLVLSRLTASFSVMLGGQRLNLGLNLKFEAKKMKVLGYSRRGDGGWEFSQKAIELIQQYMIKFPDFIAGVQRKPQGDMYNATDFYPESEVKNKMKEIQNWLKEVEAKSMEKVPLDAEQLDSDVVGILEQAAMQLPPPQYIDKKVNNSPRKAFLKPSDAEHRLGSQKFALGDRVYYVQDSGRVPIGAKGTVVGLTRTARALFLDVIFDNGFMSGTTLGERCSPFKGSTVPMSSVLNLTNRQVIATTKAGDAARAKSTTPTNTTGYGAPSRAPKQQLVDANAPPPLKNSWNAAATGRNGNPSNGINGKGIAILTKNNSQQQQSTQQRPKTDSPRGRGGRGRGGPPPNNGSPAPRGGHTPQYHSVPPPTVLDSASPSRGRGKGRGRGHGHGRGGNNGANKPAPAATTTTTTAN